MSMTSAGPMGFAKAIEHLQQLQAETKSDSPELGSEEETVIIIVNRP